MGAESHLVLGIKDGDRDVFNDIFKKFWADLVSYSELLIDHEAAKDVVQSVFVSLWKGRYNLPLTEDSELMPYLMKAVYNASLNVIRSMDVNDNYKSWYARKIEYDYSCSINPEESAIIRKLYIEQATSEIDRVIDSLPEKCREVFILRYKEGFSAKETAERLGISISTVNNQVFKALSILRNSISLLSMLVCMDVLRN